jgi:glutaredoxin
MIKLYFYTNPDCPLCDEARALLQGRTVGYELRELEIEGDLALTYHYAVRIPVLKRDDSGAELGWPFDASRLAEFLEGQ